MKVGKHTLLIDGNYFVFSRLFVLPKPKNGEQLLGDDKQKSQFMRKLAIDFASEMRKLKMFVDDVVLTVDSKSWRKDLYPEADYKGTRKQSSSVDWTAVYGVYEEFQKIVAKKVLLYIKYKVQKQMMLSSDGLQCLTRVVNHVLCGLVIKILFS